MKELKEFKNRTKDYSYLHKILYIYENYYADWYILDCDKIQKKYIKIDNLIYKKPLRLFKKEIDLINKYHKNKIEYNYKIRLLSEGISLTCPLYPFKESEQEIFKKLKRRVWNHRKLKFKNYIYFSKKDLKSLNEFIRILNLKGGN